MMAIRVLLDHDVPEEKIFLCSLLMAESGAALISLKFTQMLDFICNFVFESA